jgi:hypothetical protein
MKRIHFFTIVAILGLLVLGTAQPASAGGQPDLKVISATGVFAGGQWFMHYSIKNIGTANSGAFRVTISTRGTPLVPPTVREWFVISNLAPGATFSSSHPTGVCEFYRKIAVDSNNVVIESNELNNTREYENFC